MHVPYYYQSDLEYANKRLSSTYVLTTDDKLMLVQAIQEVENPATRKLETVAIGVKFGLGDKLKDDVPGFGLTIVQVPVKELNLAPLELGYIHSSREGRAVYVARFPMRSIYKQGLHINALSFSHGTKNSLSPSELLAPVFNSYPNLLAASSVARSKGTIIPFSRHFAVSQKGELEYLGKHLVGEIKVADKKVVAILSPKFAYLQQHLDWSLNDKRA